MRRCAVVTGSASGIGRATADLLGSQGWRVIGIDRHSAQIVADLADPRERAVAVEAAISACSGVLHGVVCAAGIGPTRSPAEIVSVNYFGAVAVARGMLGALAAGRGEARGPGSGTAAVVVSSNSVGLVSVPEPILDACAQEDEDLARALAAELDGPTAYAASKLALARRVRTAAPQWAKLGVRLNAVAPGPVDTPLLDETKRDPVLGPLTDALPLPGGRIVAQPAEIAAAIAFLLSDPASAITGAVLFADLGLDAAVRPDHV